MHCRRGRRWAFLLFLLTTWAAPARASGQGPVTAPVLPDRVRVVVPRCEIAPLEVDSLVWALRVELAGDGMTYVELAGRGSILDESASLATIALQTPCAPDAVEVTIEIDDAATAKSVKRVVSLADVPSAARPRALAIAAAELLRASWAELALQRAPAAANQALAERLRRVVALHEATTADSAHANAVPSATHAAAPSPDPVTMLAVVLDGRFFPNYASGLVGPRAELSLPLARTLPLRLRADVGAAFGSAHDPVGDIALVLVSGALGLAISSEVGPVRAEIGPRIEAGWANARGIAFDASVQASSASSAVAAVSLAAEACFRITSAWWGAAGVDAGTVLAGLDARADGRRAAGIGGPMMGIRVGAGFGW
jgi:hypothetical protein